MSDDEACRRRVGTTLRGKWVLDRLLGVGGMAAVYAATHKIGRREAIKILHPEVAGSRDIVERFEQEAHAVNRLNHPGAVEVRDHDVTEDGAPFLVMELLEGESLGARLQREPVPLGDALRYADELLDVLAAAHAEGIVHRDVKPDNLFLTREGRLKVLDFGIARMREGSPRSERTALGLTMGTPHFMPPEQVAGGAVDHRADLYAVGVTLFRLATGRHPHEGYADMELLLKASTEPAPPLCAVAPQAPATLGLVVDRALALRPEERYPDARTMQADVQALRRGEAPPFAGAHLPPRRAASARGAPTSAGAAAGAALAGVGAAAARPGPTVADALSLARGRYAPTGVAVAPGGHAPTGVVASPDGYAPTGIAPAPSGYAPTGIAPAQTPAPGGYAPTGVAAARARAGPPPAGGTAAQAPAGYAPTGVGAAQAPAASAPTVAWQPAKVGAGAPASAAAPRAAAGAAFAAVPPSAERAARPAWAARLGLGNLDHRTQRLVAFGALALLSLLLLLGGVWLFGDDDPSVSEDTPWPGPDATVGGAPPPGTITAGAGGGAPPTAQPRSGPAPTARPPSLSKERERGRDREKGGKKGKH
ncbi:MAG TPA: serine/threonine-protein kinase [Polyangiaceae bacterium]|nr:serine/threonine-protein kinase [Polyangiaceae bacterium]